MKNSNIVTAAIVAVGLLAGQAAIGQTYYKESPIVAPESSYNTAIGLRGGETSGLTIKNFITERTAFEGIVGIWPSAFGLTGLYEWYTPAFNAEGLNWYYGVGAHVVLGTNRAYYVYTDEERDRTYYRYKSGNLGIGLDGIVGLEYKIPAIPFAVSLDMKPFIEGNTEGGAFLSLDPGVGIKVAF